MEKGNEVSLGVKEAVPPMVMTIIEDLEKCDWEKSIVYYLKNLVFSRHLLDHKKRELKL